MKKKKLIITVMLVLALAAVIKLRFAIAYLVMGGETVQLERPEISTVTGTSLTSVPVRTVTLSESQIDSFVEEFNSLRIRRLPFRNTEKGGWLYGFSAFRDDGSFVSIAFLGNGLVTVDGYTCVTLRPVSGIMEEYFHS